LLFVLLCYLPKGKSIARNRVKRYTENEPFSKRLITLIIILRVIGLNFFVGKISKSVNYFFSFHFLSSSSTTVSTNNCFILFGCCEHF